MKITVTESMFISQFEACGRKDNFSYAGLSALFEYCEGREQDIGEEWELDVIALCCDFTESDIDTIANDHNIDLSDCVDLEDQFSVVLDYLESETSVIYSNERTGLILYADF